MMFPRHAYRVPGKKKGNHGVTYDALLCSDAEALAAAVKAGYSDSFKGAIDAAKAPPAVPAPAPAPTPKPDSDDVLRADVIAEMERRGLKVDKRKSTETLFAELEATDVKE